MCHHGEADVDWEALVAELREDHDRGVAPEGTLDSNAGEAEPDADEAADPEVEVEAAPPADD